MCFEILGFDIFLDEKVKPWLIEVNSLASFGTDSPLDKKIKYDLITETILMLNLNLLVDTVGLKVENGQIPHGHRRAVGQTLRG